MTIVTGKVIKINARSVSTSRGQSTSYSCKLQLKDGTESEWIGMGFDLPGFQEGDTIEAKYKANSRGFTQLEGWKPVAAEVPTVVALKAPEPAATPKVAAKYVDRNDSIVYQSSRKDALALVTLLIDQNALPLSAAKTAAGVAKRFDELTAIVDKLTVEYFHDVMTLRVLGEVEDAGAIQKSVGALPTADEAHVETWEDEGGSAS